MFKEEISSLIKKKKKEEISLNRVEYNREMERKLSIGLYCMY